MKFSSLFAFLAYIAFIVNVSYGVPIVELYVDTGSSTIQNLFGVPLTGGLSNVDHDGAVVQIGYYSAATTGHEFDGVWIPITGQGSANSALANTTIGDSYANGTANGEMFVELLMGSPTNGMNLPAVGTPLVIRFYDAITLGTSTYFEAVSNPNWRWMAPVNLPSIAVIYISLDSAGTKRQSGFPHTPGSPVRTVLTFALDATPEPILTAPVSGSSSTNLVNVAFFLSAPALPGSAKLTFTGSVTRVLTLTSSNETAGSHTFTFDASSTALSPDIVSGLPIPDGTYTVVLSYRDAMGHPAASSQAALSVTVNIDADGDGIFDKFETGTGVYVSPTNTGTDPSIPDTDGDGLTDGQEVNTYHSNPNIKDTDGDGFEDGFEVSTGFNPTSATSTPDAQSTILTAAEYRFNAAIGISYRIEASTDFANWTTVETNIIGTGGVITRFYSIEGQARRFFRSRRN